jgi:hypothetical protein
MDGKKIRIAALLANNPNRVIDLVGQRFSRLTVVERVFLKPKRTHWRCVCDCGGTCIALSLALRKGQTNSCGCFQKEVMAEFNKENQKHGHAAGLNDDGKRVTSRTYKTWASMKQRCLNPKAPNYHLYGGRGIGICEQWLGEDGFSKFLLDVGERPDGKTLDRYPDKDGDYKLGNVRWATPTEQSRNRRELSEDAKQKQLEALARGRIKAWATPETRDKMIAAKKLPRKKNFR